MVTFFAERLLFLRRKVKFEIEDYGRDYTHSPRGAADAEE